MHDGQWDMNSWELQRTFRVCLYIAKHWVVVAALLENVAFPSCSVNEFCVI